jgi:hypothetical protein
MKMVDTSLFEHNTLQLRKKRSNRRPRTQNLLLRIPKPLKVLTDLRV